MENFFSPNEYPQYIPPEPARGKTPWHNKRWVFLGVLGVAVLAMAGSGFFYFRYRGAQEEAKLSLTANLNQSTPTPVADEVKALVQLISTFMLLPDETPTLATISDLSKLKSEAFFAHAQVGDKLLIFPKAAKAVLYSPSRAKIIEVAPFSTPTPPISP